MHDPFYGQKRYLGWVSMSQDGRNCYTDQLVVANMSIVEGVDCGPLEHDLVIAANAFLLRSSKRNCFNGNGLLNAVARVNCNGFSERFKCS